MANLDPSRSTRFTSENQPPKEKRGRPKGSKSKATIRRAVDQELDRLLGQAHKNIEAALKKKDLRVSMWLIDLHAKRSVDTVDLRELGPLIRAVETFEDIERVSQEAVLLAIQGDLTFSQVKAVQEALARHSVLKGVVEIGDLRRELRELQKEEQGHDLGTGHLPSWGRMKDITPSSGANGASKKNGAGS